MKNSLVFTASGYDMVVAVTQKTLNDQIYTLCDPDIGIIKTSLICGMLPDPKTKTYTAVYYDSFDKVPKDSSGTPTLPLLNAQYIPTVSVESSGTVAHLNLNFQSGTAWFRDPFMGDLEANDMSGWVYSIAINLDFAGIERDAITANQPVPELVKKNLEHFDSNGFKISQLFLDFESVDLMQFDPTKTTAGANNPAGSAQHQSFVYFMATFLGYLKDNPAQNPYILGYTITLTPQTTDPDADVPPSLKPQGQTFNVFKDPVNDNMNNINFILNTVGGQGSLGEGSHQTPGNFDSNWIGANEQCDAKMIYSRFSLLETLIFKPFYNSLKDGCSTLIGDNISHTDNAYACTVKDGGGLSFVISNKTDGDDQYVNKYDIDFVNSDTTCVVNFTGTIYMYKSVSKDMGLCTANIWGNGNTQWTSQMVISVTLDENHKPTLNISPPTPKLTSQTSDSGENDCAKAWGTIASILGHFLDIFTFGLDGGFFTNLFENLMTPDLKGIPNPVAAFSSLGNSVQNAFMLPAGQVFFFKNPSSDSEGNVGIELTYKVETSGATPVPASGGTTTKAAAPKVAVAATAMASVAAKPAITAEDVIFTDGPHGRLAKLKNPLAVPSRPAVEPTPTKPVDPSQPQPAEPSDAPKDKPKRDRSRDRDSDSDSDRHHHHHHHHHHHRHHSRSHSRSRSRSHSRHRHGHHHSDSE